MIGFIFGGKDMREMVEILQAVELMKGSREIVSVAVALERLPAPLRDEVIRQMAAEPQCPCSAGDLAIRFANIAKLKDIDPVDLDKATLTVVTLHQTNENVTREIPIPAGAIEKFRAEYPAKRTQINAEAMGEPPSRERH